MEPRAATEGGKTFGTVLRTLRKARQGRLGTQKGLAAQLEVHPDTLRQWEQGKKIPGYEMLAKISTALRLTPSEKAELKQSYLYGIGEKLEVPRPASDPRPPAGLCISPPPYVVGRERESCLLQRWLAQALGGERQIVFVTGEHGMGKTAVVDTFLAHLPTTGDLWLARGQCVAKHGGGEPYQPVREALAQLCQGPRGQDLLRLLGRYAPTWLLQMPRWLLSEADHNALQRRTEGATPERIRRELAKALRELTAETPLVWVLEDLHWSDPATLDLIAELARQQDRARWLLLATYRPAEVLASDHPLGTLITELQTHRQCEEVPLDALSQEAVSEYLTTRFPRHTLPTALAQVLYQGTAGCPLFMVGMVEDWIARGLLREVEGTWELTGLLETLKQAKPQPKLPDEKAIPTEIQAGKEAIPALTNARLGYVPPAPPLVIGREEDVWALLERLGVVAGQRPPHSVTVVRGWPGVGKSTLATLVAHDPFIASAFPDGVLWMSLGQTPHLMAELAQWGRFVEVNIDDMGRAKTIQKAVQLLAEQFRQKRMLLVVDDVWTAEAAGPFLAMRGAACALLFTTRLREVADHIAPTPDAIYYLDVLSEKNAVELLREVAPTVVAQQPDACRLLVRSLECLPLALRVAGRLLHAEAQYGWEVAGFLAELQDGARIIEAKAPADLLDYERDTIPIVAALLKKSTDILDDHTRDCFSYLGVYAPKPATFGLAAMQASWQVEDAKPIARVLVGKGLLEPVGDRFQMHALLVSLARSFLVD